MYSRYLNHAAYTPQKHDEPPSPRQTPLPKQPSQTMPTQKPPPPPTPVPKLKSRSLQIDRSDLLVLLIILLTMQDDSTTMMLTVALYLMM